MDAINFWSFAQPKDGFVVSVVDGCLHAMEGGALSVIARQSGYYLWEFYDLTTDQWARLCALAQRHRLPPSLFWRWQSRVRLTRHPGSREPVLVSNVSDVPDAMAALSRIEFLWQDLIVVDAWVHSISIHGGYREVEWFATEVARRRQWSTGLRRAWLLVAVVG